VYVPEPPVGLAVNATLATPLFTIPVEEDVSDTESAESTTTATWLEVIVEPALSLPESSKVHAPVVVEAVVARE
jgi:hypothetical protein